MCRRFLALACSPLLIALAAGAARAESSFLLAYPTSFGHVGAATYDDSGRRIGGADLQIEHLEGGRIRLRSDSGERRGAQTTAFADLAPTEKGRGLRVLFEESRSLDEQGQPLGTLSVDHVRRVARCQDASGATVSKIGLPAADHVLNVPMNLFFKPLVRGDTRSLDFKLFLCRPNARLMDFRAWAVRKDDHSPIEIRYGPDFGIASGLIRHMVPKLSFWFDPRAPYRWMAHRIPLYSGGPEVMVVRDDVSTASLVK